LLGRLDHALGRFGGPARVLVDVRTPMNLAVLRPVWSALAADRRVRVAFTAEDAGAVGGALRADGLEDALVPRNAASWMRVDLAMTADAWNHTTLHRCRRRINFFHGVAGKYDLDRPERLAGVALDRYDRVAFINEDRLERYVRSGVVAPDRAVLVGFPKIDDLVNGAWPAKDVRASFALSPSLETVVYAPTFSTASSLHLAGEAIVAALLETGRNVIVKLHDRSMVPHYRHTAGVDWPARLRRFEGHPRYALAREADAGRCLAAADLLVTDHSTVGFEFALLDRPIVVYDTPALKAAARIDDEKWALLRSMADVVASPRELRAAVDDALADPAKLREARRRAGALFAHAGSATARALDVVYELLDLPRDVRLNPDTTTPRH
jgi:CDP-glycerol glycerophosphotransferase (TagB/SpsB family)